MPGLINLMYVSHNLEMLLTILYLGYKVSSVWRCFAGQKALFRQHLREKLKSCIAFVLKLQPVRCIAEVYVG
jgi:hypothetical protein